MIWHYAVIAYKAAAAAAAASIYYYRTVLLLLSQLKNKTNTLLVSDLLNNAKKGPYLFIRG